MWVCPKCERKFDRVDQHHFCVAPTRIDEYIAEQPERVRPLLEQVRACIHAVAPTAQERISWRMPTFWQGENIIHFAAFAKHLGVFPGDMTDIPFPERVADYHTSKGTLRFPLDKPIDFDLIADITRWRMQQARIKHPEAFDQE